jgi:hypothetical protein
MQNGVSSIFNPREVGQHSAESSEFEDRDSRVRASGILARLIESTTNESEGSRDLLDTFGLLR